MIFLKTVIQYEKRPETENETEQVRERKARLRRNILDEAETQEIVARVEDMNLAKKDRFQFFLASYMVGTITAVGLVREKQDIDEAERAFVSLIRDKVISVKSEEILFRELRRHLRTAYQEDFIGDDDEFIRENALGAFDCHGFSDDWGENLIEEPEGIEASLRETKNTLYADPLSLELRRVYRKPGRGHYYGHPVHYMFLTDNKEARKAAYRLLLGTLWQCRRIQSKRYVFLDYDPTDNFNFSWLGDIYRCCEGGTVVIRYENTTDDGEENQANVNRTGVEGIVKLMRRYSNRVLTVLCLPRKAVKLRELFYEELGPLNMVEIAEERAGGEKARSFLRTLCEGQGIKPDKNLYSALEAGRTFDMKELQDIFDNWIKEKLLSSVYSQYRKLDRAAVVAAKETPKCSAYEELMQMVGLEEAKKTITDALNFFRAQKLFRESGVNCADRPAMHMVFSGAPGTAKTSVARLMAQIFREEGILPTGSFCELTRADLCEKFVGWTAKKVQKIFRDTKGGLIFIDEAYSLCDEHNGGYGKEAIDALVAEMENNREDTMVVFAGYAAPMDKFLEQNPGLRSRISFHVHFSDYKAADLCRIAGSMA